MQTMAFFCHPQGNHAILQLSLDAPQHSLGGRVPHLIRLHQDLMEGGVVSQQSTDSWVGEVLSIPRHSVNPCNIIPLQPSCSIVFPLEHVVHPAVAAGEDGDGLLTAVCVAE
jgi:hypothetical protein